MGVPSISKQIVECHTVKDQFQSQRLLEQAYQRIGPGCRLANGSEHFKTNYRVSHQVFSPHSQVSEGPDSNPDGQSLLEQATNNQFSPTQESAQDADLPNLANHSEHFKTISRVSHQIQTQSLL